MNAAESLILTAVDAGISVCFANPGTTEMAFVAALDRVPGLRAVLGLFEGVCTGAADGYARMAGKPALTLTHLGPGFANGIANLHNARRGNVPIVNLIGDHATWHRAADAPLGSDIESLARPMSTWIRTSRAAADLPRDGAEAIAAARTAPGGIATLIVASDLAAGEAAGPARPLPAEPRTAVDPARLGRAAGVLRSGKPAALLLGGPALVEPAQRAAARIAAATGCQLLCDTFPPRMERGAGLPALEKVPYFPEQALERLGGLAFLVVAGTREPVAFFGYPGLPSRLVPPGTDAFILARPEDDATSALEALADLVGASHETPRTPARVLSHPTGPLSIRTLGEAIAALQPEGTILVDEGNTSSHGYFAASAGAPRSTYLANPGGSIGFGPPCATGAALACPDRRVIALQADGSAMYTVQALWTQAREALDVTTVIVSNRSYRILQVELGRVGIAEPGRQAAALTNLTNPEIGWVELAGALGVSGARVASADALVVELRRALAARGPSLIEALL